MAGCRRRLQEGVSRLIFEGKKEVNSPLVYQNPVNEISKLLLLLVVWLMDLNCFNHREMAVSHLHVELADGDIVLVQFSLLIEVGEHGVFSFLSVDPNIVKDRPIPFDDFGQKVEEIHVCHIQILISS